MVHLYILTRGVKEKVERWISDLGAQYFPYKTGVAPNDTQMMQIGVRPIQLWELAFPEPNLDEVLRTIKPMSFKGENKMSNIRWIMDKLCNVLRKILKLKEVPKWEEKGQIRILGEREWIDVRAIGLKDDKKAEIELI